MQKNILPFLQTAISLFGQFMITAFMMVFHTALYPVSSAFPAGIDTIFITPFVRGFNGKREEPKPDNEIGHLFTHRLYTYNTKQATDKTASKSAEAPAPEAKYIGLD